MRPASCREMDFMKIGLLVGMEDTFPRALLDRLQLLGGESVTAEFMHLSGLRHDAESEYDVVLDRISHEVVYYQAHLRHLRLSGTRIVNDPFIMGADDRFLDAGVAARLGLRVPRTVVLPQKHYPDTVTGGSLRNLAYPLPWEEHLAWVGVPAVLKPAGLKGWRQASRVRNLQELLRAYDRTGDTVMMLQEDVPWSRYVRCLVFGGERVVVARFDPEYRQYLADADYLEPGLEELLVHDSARLARALGYDLCAIEFAIADDGPVAMEFINPVPDFDVSIVTPYYFEKIVDAAAGMLLELGRMGRTKATWPPRGKAGLSAWVSSVPGASKAGAGRAPSRKAAAEGSAASRRSAASRVRTPRKPPSTRQRKKKA